MIIFGATKLCFVYPNHVQLKPTTLTYFQWYKRLARAGDLYVTNTSYKNPQLLLPNVIQYCNCFGRQCCVDIFGQLWYSEKDVCLLSLYGIDFDNHVELDDDLCPPIWEHDYEVLVTLSLRRPTLIMTKVMMVHLTNIGDFILMDNGKLYFVGLGSNTLTLKRPDVKFISGTSSLCFYINNRDELFYYRIVGYEVKRTFICSRVKSAFGNTFYDEYDSTNEIFFEDFNQGQWIGTSTCIKPRDRDPQTFDLHLKDSTLIFTEPGGCIFHVVDTDVSAFDEQKKFAYYIKRLAKH